MKKYYVYRITNTVLNKHYYGYRSIDEHILPLNDLGVNYFSSSSDKSFITEQKLYHKNFKYKIILETYDKIKAIRVEIKLHNKFKVNVNRNFYNKAIQTSTGCSIVTTGKFKVYIDGILQLTDRDHYDPSYMIAPNKNKVVALDIVTNEKILIDKEIFDNSPRYIGHTRDMVVAIDQLTGLKVKITKKEFHSGNYIHYNKNRKHSQEIKEKLSNQRKTIITAKNYDGEIRRLSINDPLILNGEYSQLNALKYSIVKNGVYLKNTIAIHIELKKLGYSDEQLKKIKYKMSYEFSVKKSKSLEIYDLLITKLEM